MNNNTPKLCYVTGNWAYFTTQPIQLQSGDEWKNAPYKHNAGEPYEYAVEWTITKVAFDGDFELPGQYELNSCFSVDDINALKVPWLTSFGKLLDSSECWAGTTLDDFTKFITDNGGNVYTKQTT